MAEFLNFFSRVWIWCVSLFGGKESNDNNNGAFPGVTSLLQILQILDVTSNQNDFLSRNIDFYRDMSSRHGSPHFKLNWHFMSGAATFIPSLNVNILFERLFYSLDPGKGHRAIVDKSFIVYTAWSNNWSFPISPTRLVQVNETIGSIYSDDLNNGSRTMEGPEDPRVVFNVNKNEININFNSLTPLEDRQMFGQTIRIEHSHQDIQYIKTEPLVQFEHMKGYRAGTEKNWVPILIKDELHYVYSLSPLRILKCETSSGVTAKSVKKKPNIDNQKKDLTTYKKVCNVEFKGEMVDSGSQTGALRSGTNWVEYSPGVYFSLARTRIMHKKCSYAIYRPHLIILKFNIDSISGKYTDPHVISVSEPITEYDDMLFELYSKKGLSSGDKCDDQAVLTPGSISNWTGMGDDIDSDVANVIISINDDMNAMLKVKGFGLAVQKALDSAPSIKQARSISRKGTLVVRAEKEMKNFVEKSFSKYKK